MKLLTEAEIAKVEALNLRDGSHRPWPADFGARLIADHRRLTEAIRTAEHLDLRGPGVYCLWRSKEEQMRHMTEDCTPLNCIWTEIAEIAAEEKR